jgi:hypothetical protein
MILRMNSMIYDVIILYYNINKSKVSVHCKGKILSTHF